LCTRLCSVHHFGPRIRPPKIDVVEINRAESVHWGKTDRSLSPMKFHEDESGRRRFASTMNKDWALSEVYKFVRQKTLALENGEDFQLDENFK
jgi:hypothetical protein